MAFRGAIAFSKGLTKVKQREEKKKEEARVKKWEIKYRNQTSNKTDIKDDSFQMPDRQHTHEGIIRFKRTKTAYGAQNDSKKYHASHEYSVAELNRMNTWQHPNMMAADSSF